MTTKETEGTPFYLLDLVRMRGDLAVDARGSLRIILDPTPSGKLHIALECCACEEMLEWAPDDTWWLCPGCGQEFTDPEVEGVLTACAKAFVAGTAQDVEEEAEEPATATEPVVDRDVGEGNRPWRKKLRGWIKGR